MIDARGHLILIDFGLSKQEISHPRGALSLVGTPDYSAPEVLRTGVQQIEAHNRARANGKKKKLKKPVEDPTASLSPHIGYGKAADWWSLGIMIYEMLAGKPTFRGTDLRETYQRILYAKLEFTPEDRFSESAKQLLTGLINRYLGNTFLFEVFESVVHASSLFNVFSLQRSSPASWCLGQSAPRYYGLSILRRYRVGWYL